VVASNMRAQSFGSQGEVTPHYWSRRGIRPVRVAVLADDANTLRALIDWAATSSHELVLAIQLRLVPKDVGAEMFTALLDRAGDVPILTTRSVDRVIAPSLTGSMVDLLLTCTQQVLPAHLVQTPRLGSLELGHPQAPALDGHLEWVLRSLTDRGNQRVILSRAVERGSDPADTQVEPAGVGEALTFVLDDGVQRWLATADAFG
jgi:hypothetical protein